LTGETKVPTAPHPHLDSQVWRASQISVKPKMSIMGTSRRRALGPVWYARIRHAVDLGFKLKSGHALLVNN